MTEQRHDDLSPLQKNILRHVWSRTAEAYRRASTNERVAIFTEGIPWQPRGANRVWPAGARVNVSRSPARLEKRGLIERVAPAGRAKRVRLTTDGMDVASRLIQRSR